jgi:hypothetical protein
MTRRSLAALLLIVGCEKTPADSLENATPSPNASILPAPLSSLGQPAAETPTSTQLRAAAGQTSEGAGKLAAGDAAVVQPMRGDQPPGGDALTQRELQGVTLEGEWRYFDPGAPPKAPEVNLPGIEAARKLTAPHLTIELASVGRMRVTFASRALPLVQGAEIRSRVDLYGHLLVWPNSSKYRVLPPGAVRTLFGERRVDAVPLVRAQSSGKGDGARRLGYPTNKWDLSTRTGKLSLEQAKLTGAGEGGSLFCRFVSEIIAIDPSAAPCSADEVPLRAQFTWPSGGSVVFEVFAIKDKVEFSTGQMLVPPSGGEFTPTSLPPTPNSVFLTREELAAFRSRALEIVGLHAPGAPQEGLVLHNATDSLRYAFVDTVPVAWILPNREQHVAGLLKGRYFVQWRTFLGDSVEPPVIVEVPARIAIGVAIDAGLRDR